MKQQFMHALQPEVEKWLESGPCIGTSEAGLIHMFTPLMRILMVSINELDAYLKSAEISPLS